MNDQQQSRADALTEAVTHTIETIKRQLDLIADRAPSNFLDKRSVVQSLTAHVRRLEKALAASPVEQPALLTAQDALAAIETFEIVGDNNDSREPNAEDRFILTEFVAHLFGGFRVELPAAAPASANETGAEGATWYDRWQAECTRDHGEYDENAPIADRLRWWVPKSARHGTILLEDDLREAADELSRSPAMAAAAPADERASGMPDEVRDSMMDSQYLAGVTAGWNAANADDPNAALKKIHAAYSGYLNPLRDWQKAGRPGAPATPATADERAAFDLAEFCELIDDYQCAQKDGTHDERAKARFALMNASRAAASPAAEEMRDAAMRTVQAMGLVYTPGSDHWRPNLNHAPAAEAVAYVCSASNDFAPIVRDKDSAQRLSDAHGDGKIVPLYAAPQPAPADERAANRNAQLACRREILAEAIEGSSGKAELERLIGILDECAAKAAVAEDILKPFLRASSSAMAAASPAAERVTAALQALSADVHTLGDGWANDEAMIGLAKKYLRVEPKPASPELSLWRDFVLLAVTDAAPQPAQADAPAGIDVGVDCLTRVRKLMTRFGIASDESIEGFSASIEDHLNRLVRVANAFLDKAGAPAEAREPHFDDVAVDWFSSVMKRKLALARDKGRGGWETCSPADLSRMLREHVEKGDPRDVANFCMMLWHHGSPIVSAPADAAEAVAIVRRQPNGAIAMFAPNGKPFDMSAFVGATFYTAPAAARVASLTDVPSLTNPLTPYGMLVRALRIISDTLLGDMAKHLGCSSAMLSAVEVGRMPLTDAMIADTAAYFSSVGIPDTLHALNVASRARALFNGADQ